MSKVIPETPQKPAKLFILSPSGRMDEVRLINSCVIGRKTKDSKAEIQLNCAIASRRHGEFAVVENEYFYRDLGSLNGTFVNGVLYSKNTMLNPVKLANGDVLKIDWSDGAGVHPQALLMIFATDYPDAFYWEYKQLTQDISKVNVGRGYDDNDVLLINKMVAKRHASFLRGDVGWAIEDHASKNGVFLNNSRISIVFALRPFDVVRIVNTHFVFTGDCLIFQQRVDKDETIGSKNTLSIHILERSVSQRLKKQTLLKNIRITVESGEMVMILGGSGAGKTTFMNAVMGYEKAEGQILYGQTDIYNEYEKMKYEIGFVPQQDLLRGKDTVYDTLCNAADMKLPRSTTAEQKSTRIEEVLETLGLSREQDSLVVKLSGGQRKRLSIAVEFISDPSLFFLDEPDSGLDGVMAKSLNENLRAIADNGKIVMVITHSPDRVAHLYNKVIVLAKSTEDNSGHLAFYGSIPEALKYFDTDSLEGVVRRINRPDEGGEGKSDFYIEKYECLTEQER